MQSPVKKEYITQVFGANPASYAQFGLKGHNGIDYRAFLSNGDRCYEAGKSEVFAPHGGKVIENAYDAGGYGNYIKIEDGSQGSVLAHFSARSPMPVGATITQGELVGYQGTTGNSTGIHLHWGWYPIPRNRNNGYNGFENQAGKYQPYTQGGSMANVTVDSATYEMLVTKATKYDEIVATGYVLKPEHDNIVSEKNKALSEKDARITQLEQVNVDLQSQLTECQSQTLPPPTVGWVENGLTVEITEGNKKTITNYKKE
jgi:hypothetical protein